MSKARKTKAAKQIATEEFDSKFEAGEDIEAHLKPAGKDTWRLIVDFPQWMAVEIKAAAEDLGINKQALVKVWIADRIRQQKPEKTKVG